MLKQAISAFTYYSVASHLYAMNLTLCQLTKFRMTKLKALAVDKINVDHRMIFVFDSVKFMIGKGENGRHLDVLEKEGF